LGARKSHIVEVEVERLLLVCVEIIRRRMPGTRDDYVWRRPIRWRVAGHVITMTTRSPPV